MRVRACAGFFAGRQRKNRAVPGGAKRATGPLIRTAGLLCLRVLTLFFFLHHIANVMADSTTASSGTTSTTNIDSGTSAVGNVNDLLSANTSTYKTMVAIGLMVFMLLFCIFLQRNLHKSFNMYMVMYVIAGLFGVLMVAFTSEINADITTAAFFKPTLILLGVSVLVLLIGYLAKYWLARDWGDLSNEPIPTN
jgi:hypothetical protein